MTRAPAEGLLASFLFGHRGLAGGPGSKGGRSAAWVSDAGSRRCSDSIRSVVR